MEKFKKQLRPALDKSSQKAYSLKKALKTSREIVFFERMAITQERIAVAIEKQKPGRAEKAIATVAAVAGSMGIISIADTILRWFGG